MARKHGGLGRGLDALIPMRKEVEKAMESAESEGVEILFADDEEADLPVQEEKKDVTLPQETLPEEKQEKKEIVSRETQEIAPEEKKDTVTVRISEVEPNRKQPRKKFDDEKLEELSESIKTYGLRLKQGSKKYLSLSGNTMRKRSWSCL